MPAAKSGWWLMIASVAATILVSGPGRAAEKIKAEVIVARHLEALGTAEARAGVAHRVATGTSVLRVVVGQTLSYQGRVRFSSEPRRFKIALPFRDHTYWGEQFVFDGQDATVGFVQPAERSTLGGFLQRHDAILREELLGGALNAAWPLLDLAAHAPKLAERGAEKIDGQETYRLGYRAKKGMGDLTVTLFFDATTFRHVRTTYSYSRVQSIGGDPTTSSQQREYRNALDERFSDFKVADGLTLPTRWTMEYVVESTKRTSSMRWETTLDAVSHQAPVPPVAFVLDDRPQP
jgi:hypothetical protein